MAFKNIYLRCRSNSIFLKTGGPWSLWVSRIDRGTANKKLIKIRNASTARAADRGALQLLETTARLCWMDRRAVESTPRFRTRSHAVHTTTIHIRCREQMT